MNRIRDGTYLSNDLCKCYEVLLRWHQNSKYRIDREPKKTKSSFAKE